MNNSNLFVRNIPSIKEREFKYRAKMSSEQLNEMQKEAFDDILDLFNKANQLQKSVYELSLANSIESICYSKRLEETITNLNRLKEQYDNLTSNEDDYRYITRFAYDATVDDNGFAAVVDKNTNDIVSHIVSSISKTRLYDDTYDETLVPASLQAYLGPDSFQVGGSIYSIEDSDIRNAFDGSDGTVWFRKVVTTPDVQSIENELVIGLPEDIITTRLMNQIIVKTFPVGYIDIIDIQYKSNGAWQTIPGFKDHTMCQEYDVTDIFGNKKTEYGLMNASNVKFNFQGIQTNQLKIKLRQRNYDYDAENNRRIWYLGLRDVDILYNVYTRDHSEFDIVYDFTETDKEIKVYDTEVVFNNPHLTDDNSFGITKEYFYYDSNDNPHKIPSTCPFILQGHKMMVRFTIEGSQTTPNIHSARVKYKLA